MVYYLLSPDEASGACGLLAQLVEHIVHIDGVTGSSPVQTTNQPCKVNLAGLFRFIPRLIFRSFASMEVFRWPPPVADSGRRKTVRGCASLAAFFVFSPLVRADGVFRRPPPAADSGRRKTARNCASPAAFSTFSSQKTSKILCKISSSSASNKVKGGRTHAG